MGEGNRIELKLNWIEMTARKQEVKFLGERLSAKNWSEYFVFIYYSVSANCYEMPAKSQ